MLKKLAFIAPLLALIALLIWWFTPRYAEEDVAYYRSVFCVIDHQDSRAFLRDMENMIEGGNSDYALHKTHYVPALGQRMLDTAAVDAGRAEKYQPGPAALSPADERKAAPGLRHITAQNDSLTIIENNILLRRAEC